MCLFSRWKNLFGQPGQGIHRFRLFGLAAVDLIITIILALAISFYGKWSFLSVLLVLIIVSLVVHYTFGVETSLLKWAKISC